MGVDYFHGVYATDSSTSGSLKTAQEIEDVLRTHGLVDEAVSRWCLDAEDVRLMASGETSAAVRNVGLSFRSMSGKGAAITDCLLGNADAEPYMDWETAAWAEFFIVSGPDYRLMTPGESGPDVHVIEPAVVEGEDLVGFSPAKPGPPDEGPAGWGYVPFGATAFDASTGCTAPVCELDWFEQPIDPRTNEPIEGPKGFDGLWRTALLIQTKPLGWIFDDSFGTYLRFVLPETGFKSDLWSALGGSAFEMGYAC